MPLINTHRHRGNHALSRPPSKPKTSLTGRKLIFLSLPLALFAAVGVVALAGSAAAALPSNCTPSGITVTCTFGYNGTDGSDGAAQTWTVPGGVTSATFDVQGAQGGSTEDGFFGGEGGEAMADLALTPNATVTLVVGGQGGLGGVELGVAGAGGFNGGAAGGFVGDTGAGAGGGGASDVRIGGSGLSSRALVAGGGGGAANAASSCAAAGGGGGGLTGGAGVAAVSPCVGGSGGNQDGTSGSGQLGAGSVGANSGGTFGGNDGGGGGGGYYGGAGGSTVGGGGGGSGSGPAGTTFKTGVRSGDGVIVISYKLAASDLAATLVSDSNGKAPGTALADKAAAIQAAVNAGQTAIACTDIANYLGLVKAQTGKKLSASDATTLTNDANNVATALGC